MRKLKLQLQISVDGFVAGPNGELNWTVTSDEKLWQLINKLPDDSGILLLGRKMAMDFIPHFEAFDPGHDKFAFAQKMINIPKIIFSNTLKKPFGKNTILSKGNLAVEIKQLKNQPGKDILVYGGAGFVAALIAGGLIDEFFFFVNPVMINQGMRVFDLLNNRQQLSLLSATAYDCGVTVLHYRLKND